MWFKRTRSSLNEFGIGFIEAMIAVAITATTAIVIGYLITQIRKSSVQLNSQTQCRQRAQATLDLWKNRDNKLLIDNWHPCSSCVTPQPITGLKDSQRFYKQQPVYMASPLTANQTNTAQLIDNATNLAAFLYNYNGVTHPYCNIPPVTVPPTPPGLKISQAISPTAITSLATVPLGQSIPNNPGSLQLPGPPVVQTLVPMGNPINATEQIWLNIQIMDFSANIVRPCGWTSMQPGYVGPQRFIPLGSSNSALPETYLGLQLTSTVNFIDNNNVPVSCQAQTVVKPEGSTTPPAFIDPSSGTQAVNISQDCHPGGVCIDILGHSHFWDGSTATYCGQPGPSPSVLNFSFAAQEPGVVFGCYIQAQSTKPTAPLPGLAVFQPCNNYTFVDDRGNVMTSTVSLITNPAAPSNVTGIVIQIAHPVDDWYMISVKAWDSAQNATETDSVPYGVDYTRPDQITINPPTFPPIFSAPVAGIVDQCSQNNLADAFWTANVSNTGNIPQIAPAGAYWTIGGVDMSHGACSAGALSPAPVVDGTTYPVIAHACDTCNDTFGDPSLKTATMKLIAKLSSPCVPAPPAPTPTPTPGPSPTPSPTPTPFACNQYTELFCTPVAPVGSPCAVTPRLIGWFDPTLALPSAYPAGQTNVVPNCGNNVGGSCSPGNRGATFTPYNPCPVTFLPGTPCVQGYECSSGVCNPGAPSGTCQ